MKYFVATGGPHWIVETEIVDVSDEPSFFKVAEVVNAPLELCRYNLTTLEFDTTEQWLEHTI